VSPVEEAGDLVAGLLDRPWGQVSPSVYETGRLVTLAPWLTGHRARIDHLLAAQRPDGGWGLPGYDLVPTLSAVEGLLSAFQADTPPVDRGLAFLRQVLSPSSRPEIPDMPAIELVGPYLIELINQHLDGLSAADDRLKAPTALDRGRLATVRALLRAGGPLPKKLEHALEVAGPASVAHSAVRPEHTGVIGASPAATAAWLGPTGTDPAARGFLEAAALQHGGPVPCGLPITVFERAWVVAWLLRAGVPITLPPGLLAELAAAIGPLGTPAAAGLPADADTTAVALYALSLAGAARPPHALAGYELDTHFCTWQGEDGASVSTNAHVLEALGHFMAGHPEARARHTPAAAKAAAWLRDRQSDDGHWRDRWHASPYYATFCAALALHDFGGPESKPAVHRAVRWVLESQRDDGSWGGRWGGTAEETAYAIQILRLTGAASDQVERAVHTGRPHLARRPESGPPLWHDKDLYIATAVVEAARLAALHLSTDE
jgi:hypothetical protein